MQTYISAKRQYRYDVYSPSTAPSYGSVPCDTTNNLSEFSQRKSSIFTYVKNYETILNEKGARISWSNLVDDSILYPFRFHDEVDTIRSPNKQSLLFGGGKQAIGLWTLGLIKLVHFIIILIA